jgi:hypothetical protein
VTGVDERFRPSFSIERTVVRSRLDEDDMGVSSASRPASVAPAVPPPATTKSVDIA